MPRKFGRRSRLLPGLPVGGARDLDVSPAMSSTLPETGESVSLTDLVTRAQAGDRVAIAECLDWWVSMKRSGRGVHPVLDSYVVGVVDRIAGGADLREALGVTGRLAEPRELWWRDLCLARMVAERIESGERVTPATHAVAAQEAIGLDTVRAAWRRYRAQMLAERPRLRASLRN